MKSKPHRKIDGWLTCPVIPSHGPEPDLTQASYGYAWLPAEVAWVYLP